MTTSITLVPLNTYPAQTVAYGPVSIPDNVTQIQVQIARCTSVDTTIWPDAGTSISLTEDVSIAGGPFQRLVDGIFFGGIEKNKLGVESAFDYFGDPLPPGTGRQVRGTLTLSAATKSSLVLVTTP